VRPALTKEFERWETVQEGWFDQRGIATRRNGYSDSNDRKSDKARREKTNHKGSRPIGSGWRNHREDTWRLRDTDLASS